MTSKDASTAIEHGNCPNDDDDDFMKEIMEALENAEVEPVVVVEEVKKIGRAHV